MFIRDSVHLVRCFDDENIMHVVADAGTNVPVDPLGDIETIDLELIMADLEMVNRRVEKAAKAAKGDKKFLHEAEVFKACLLSTSRCVYETAVGHCRTGYCRRAGVFQKILRGSEYLLRRLGNDRIRKRSDHEVTRFGRH